MAVTPVPDSSELPAEAGRRDFFPVRWARSVRRKGLRGAVTGRIDRIKGWWADQQLRAAERRFARAGDRIQAYGLTFSMANPLIKLYQKIHLRDEVHEADEVRMARAHLDPSLPTVELGGSIGVVACLTNRMLQRPEDHVVVEANPLMTPTLRENRDLNGCKFEILTAAVAYGSPEVEFTIGVDAMTGRLQADGAEKYRVPAVSLREIVETRGFGAINLIVDIEGGEIDLVANELDVLKKHARFFFLETHERMLDDGSTPKMLDALEAAGFRILEGDREEPFVFTFVNDALATA